MSPPPAIFNIFRDRKKPKDGTHNDDDLSFVKAAAWAWYQHGSGSEGKPMREFDITRSRQVYRPSRYKLEALMMRTKAKTKEGSQTPSPAHSHDNSLLDNFEVDSTSKQLDRLAESRGNGLSSSFLDLRGIHQQKGKPLHNGVKAMTKQKKKNAVMEIFRLRHPVLCGTRDDVNRRVLVGRQLPESPVPVAKDAYL
ncbi:hypothetical protein K2173_023227 [Erythroxylum novogranatense]|uniref:Uncharacterized protein n=1 Tax=Erythroxylum novogranatense TaxID=1862640 RepID=A0AAV8T8P0_9ROSI|nr:hypothetical protein K2173_023227 [Erythroxylum novogranatense]